MRDSTGLTFTVKLFSLLFLLLFSSPFFCLTFIQRLSEKQWPASQATPLALDSSPLQLSFSRVVLSLASPPSLSPGVPPLIQCQHSPIHKTLPLLSQFFQRHPAATLFWALIFFSPPFSFLLLLLSYMLEFFFPWFGPSHCFFFCFPFRLQTFDWANFLLHFFFFNPFGCVFYPPLLLLSFASLGSFFCLPPNQLTFCGVLRFASPCHFFFRNDDF